MEGYITYSDLKNGTLNLYDVFVLNQMIEKKQQFMQEEERKIKRNIALKKAK